MAEYIQSIRALIGHRPLILVGAGVFVAARGKILLQKRRDNGCWADHGGCMELDETVEETARRELFEETGLTAGEMIYLGVFSGPEMRYTYPNGDEVCLVGHYYLCEDFSGEPSMDTGEVAELKWFPLDELPKNISAPVVKAVARCVEVLREKAKRLLETKRLILRRFRPADLPDFVALIQDKMRSPMAVYDDQFPTDPESLEGVLDYFAGTDEVYAVELRASGQVVGFISLNRVDGETRNLGYCLHSAYQGQGLASEGVAALLAYAKEALGVTRLVSGTAEANHASVRLLEKFGFRLTGHAESSFANDADGRPIVFRACAYERML